MAPRCSASRKPRTLCSDRIGHRLAALFQPLPGRCMVRAKDFREKTNEALPLRRRPHGRGDRGHGPRRHRGADRNPQFDALCGEGRSGGCGADHLAPEARSRGEGRARQADLAGEAALAGRQAAEDHGGADQLRQAYRGNAARPQHRGGHGAVLARHRKGRHFPQVEHVAGRPVGRHSDALPRSPQRSRGGACRHHRQAGQRYSEGEGLRLHRGLCARPRHDHARRRGPQLPQVARRLHGARSRG